MLDGQCRLLRLTNHFAEIDSQNTGIVAVGRRVNLSRIKEFGEDENNYQLSLIFLLGIYIII
jgi:hypothetical protein